MAERSTFQKKLHICSYEVGIVAETQMLVQVMSQLVLAVPLWANQCVFLPQSTWSLRTCCTKHSLFDVILRNRWSHASGVRCHVEDLPPVALVDAALHNNKSHFIHGNAGTSERLVLLQGSSIDTDINV